MAAGDFSTAQLASVQVKAENMWTNSQEKESYKAQVEIQKALITNQLAKVDPKIEDANKDYDVKVNWIDASNLVVQDAVAQCNLNFPELETKSKTHALTIRKQIGFSVDEEKLRTSIFNREELVAKGMLGCMKSLDEFVSMTAAVKMKAFAGANIAPTSITGASYAAGTTTVPAASYTKKMFAGLIKTAALNRLTDYFLIDNGELMVDYMDAKFDSGNDNGKGDQARYDAIRAYFDLFNFSLAGITEDTLLISRYAYAFANKTRYSARPQEIGGKVNQTVYTIESFNIPGVKYDVYYEMTCDTTTDTTQRHIKHNWMLDLKCDWLQNPASDFTANQTGILTFSKGA